MNDLLNWLSITEVLAALGVLAVGTIFGFHKGAVLAIAVTIWGLAAERDTISTDPYVRPRAYYFNRSDPLIADLGNPARADRAEALLTGRTADHVRKLIATALSDRETSADESNGPSVYRRLLRIRGCGPRWSDFDVLRQEFEQEADARRQAILFELMMATGLDEAGRYWAAHAGDASIEAPAWRGLDTALQLGRVSKGMKRELVKALVVHLVGLPATDDLTSPGPAKILIRILGFGALKHLVRAEVLDPDNPRLAENLRAMSEGRLLLPLSTHEALIVALRERGADPAAEEALQEAIAMLGLRGDAATRARLEELKKSKETRPGAERGLQILDGGVESR